MKPVSRIRTFAIATVICCAILCPSAQQVQGDYLMFVGSYTNTSAKGIYVATFDSRSGDLGPLELVAEGPYPAQIWVSPDGRSLYAANWQATDRAPGNTVTAYAIDRHGGTLTFLNAVACGGDGPNQVVVDPSGRVAIAVNYRSGSVAAFAIENDGRLTEAFYVDQHTGSPTPPSRQPGPRAHGVEFSQDSRFAYVADIGLDRVYSYRLDAAHRRMSPMEPPYVTVKAGSGPRRLQLHPNGRFLYVNRETDSYVSVFAASAGHLTQIQEISTVPAGFSRPTTTAEIQIDKAGRFLYVSNRGHDTVAVFSVDGGSGRLTPVQYANAGGAVPRNFRLDPTGRYLFTSNQNGENLVEFRVDSRTGTLTPAGPELKLANPGSIFFVKRQ